MKKQIGNIPLTKIALGREEEKAAVSVLRSGWLTQGEQVRVFEQMLCQTTGGEHAVVTTSATTALHLTLLTLGIGPGDEVIVPSFSFVATANAVMMVGAMPVFADIDLASFNIDPREIERHITKKTKAILPVHQFGLAADLTAISSIAKKHKLFVIEDAACALGAVYKNRPIGAHGNPTCFSFHPRKSITTGEGGVIIFKNAKRARLAQMLRDHGMSASDLTRHKAKRIVFETYPFVGYNFRMTDIQAAIGIEQLKRLPLLLSRRKAVAKWYTDGFMGTETIQIPSSQPDSPHSWQSYVLYLPTLSRVKRNRLMQLLFDDGIATRRGAPAIHLEKPYRKLYPKLRLPNTKKAAQQTITLPLFPQMTEEETTFVITRFLHHLKRIA